MKELFWQIVKFGIVGVVAAVIDVGVLTLLKEVFLVDVLLASAISFSVSVVVNYVCSMRFVFCGKQQSKCREFLIFLCLSIGGLLLNQLVMWLGVDCFCAHYLLVKIFAMLIVPVYNFITRKVFLESKEG
ncbi:MAG: GtrA family protein [Clostridia bacterium]|nr:GtrA family protein [Clostridia bacterium]